MKPPRFPAGARIGRIRIEGVLGAGGMGEVYRGFDEALHRWVAVKSVRFERGFGPEVKARFVREARLLSQLDHPGICRVYDLIEGSESDFLVLELVEGPTLRGVLREGLARESALRVAEEVADALAAAHRQGIVHRDLKPENIMLTPSGAVKVLDFGIARSIGDTPRSAEPAGPAASPLPPVDGAPETVGWDLTGSAAGADREYSPTTFSTRVGTIVGTARYMSPEQAGGGLVGAASDMYSLGVVLHEMLRGADPYGGAAGPELAVKVVRAEVMPLPGLPRELAQLLAELLCLDGRGRPSADETRRRLRRVRERPQRLRRRAALIVAAAAALSVTAAGVGVGLHSRAQTRRQVELAQRFTAQVQEAESLLWREQSLPLHDVRPARAAMRARLARLAEEVQRAGGVAAGPGHAAQGRGWLALGDHAEARRHLETAWNSGYRTAETAYALGLVYGKLYDEALREAERVVAVDLRQRRRQEAAVAWRDPALAYLRAAAGAAGVVPEYVEALIALYEGRRDQALALTRSAFAQAGWLYEAKVLEGGVLTAMATDGWWEGRWETALAQANAASDALSQAIRIGESDPAIYEGLCALWARAFRHSVWNLGEAPEDLFARAEDACRQGLVADPDRVELLCELADVLGDRAEYLFTRGQDAEEPLAASLEILQRAVQADPSSTRAATLLASHHWLQGKIEMASSSDPRPSFAIGLEWARRVSLADPRSWRAFSTQGHILLEQGLYENWIGEDPRDTLGQAMAAYRTSIALDAGDLTSPVNLGMAAALLARFEVRRLGQMPGVLAQEAAEVLRGVIEKNPRMSWAHRTLGDLLCQLGEGAILDGTDPSRELAGAARHLEQAGAIKFNDVNTWIFLAETHLASAEWEVDQGRDPGAPLARCGAALARGNHVKADTSSLTKLAGAMEMVRSRWLAGQGRSPLAVLAAAERLYQRAVAMDPSDQEAHAALLEVGLAKLEWESRRHPPDDRAVGRIHEALEALEGALPDLWWLPVARGRLRLLDLGGARCRSEDGRRQAAAALEEMERVFASRQGVAARHRERSTRVRQLAAAYPQATGGPADLPRLNVVAPGADSR